MNAKTTIAMSRETFDFLEHIIQTLPISERVRSKEDAVVWMKDNLSIAAKDILKVPVLDKANV